MPPSVFVIIVNYNSEKFIRPCLQSLKKQTFKNFKLVVVDNASTDGSLESIKQLVNYELRVKDKKNNPQSATRNRVIVKLIRNKQNLGFPAAANQGIKYALKNKADYVVLVGFDTIADKNWLAQLVKTAQTTSAGIIQSKILFYPSGPQVGGQEKIQSLGNKITFLGFGFPSPKPQKEIDYASGTAMLIKKEVFEKIGFFDERLMFMEDLDFGWRARKAGFKIALAPNSKIYHRYQFLRYKKKYYYLERSRKLVLLKNQKPAILFFLFPVFFLAEIAIFGYALLTGWFFDKIRAEIYFWKNLR